MSHIMKDFFFPVAMLSGCPRGPSEVREREREGERGSKGKKACAESEREAAAVSSLF